MGNMVMPHILAVDDDPNILQMVSKYLTENEFRVLAVSSGREIERALETDVMDMVVLDLKLKNEYGKLLN